MAKGYWVGGLVKRVVICRGEGGGEREGRRGGREGEGGERGRGGRGRKANVSNYT